MHFRFVNFTLAIGLSVWLPTAAFAQSRVDQLNAGGAVSGTDLIANCQGCGNAVALVKTTMAQVLTYIQANLSGFAAISGSPTTGNCTKWISATQVGDAGAACGAGGGSVSVTAGTSNIVVTPSPGTGTFTIGTTNAQNTQSGTGAYAIAAGDVTKQILRTNASGGADTIANATGSFGAGYTTLYSTTAFAGNTITPTTATINGLSVLKLGSWQYAVIDSDGTNYHAGLGLPQPATQTGTTLLFDDMIWRIPGFSTLSGTASAAQIAGSAASHAVPVDVAGTPTWKVIGDCQDSGGNHLNFTQSTDAFSCGTSGGSGGGGMFGYSDNGLTLTAGTRFVPIYGSGTPSTTEADYSTKSPSATTATNLQVNLSADPGAGQTLVVTLRKAGADTALTCTVTGGSGVVCQDLTHSVNVAQNDLIDWKVVTTGTFVSTPSLTILANNGTSNVGVTSIATTSPITGGTITTTGTIACATCVVASSPGVGIAHFAGSTQTVTSSAVNLAGSDVTGALPQTGIAPATFATGTTHTLVAPAEIWECTGTCTVTPPTPAAGYQFCVRNANGVSTVITLAAVASVLYEKTNFTTYGTANTASTSGGAVGDKVCIVGKDSTHYDVFAFNGTWSMP